MKIPSATYRLQFTPDFGFAEASEVLPYLHDLGISDIYASPIFHARAGSRHGYDVVDPNRLNPELGSDEAFASLIEQSHRQGLGWVQDIVPNHMAYDGQNRMLMDVLENGEASPFFDFFDIDWQHPYESMRGKVLAPFLGGFYGECLEKGEIALHYDRYGLGVRYFSLQLPVNLESYSEVLTQNLNLLRKRLGSHHLDFIKLLGVLYALKNIPPKQESADRADQILFVKRMLWELYTGTPEIKEHLDTNIARFNGTPGNPESFSLLDRLLSQQHYRLSFWKVAAEELDYRRFFNINELISLRVEDEKVFRHSHALIFKLVREGKFSGLRVDHVDGLYDPLGYLARLRGEAGNLYLTVEKILGVDEELPADWPVEGTTGYDYLNVLNGIFCAGEQRRRFSQTYERFTGLETSWPALMTEKKRLIIGKYMAGDIESLAYLLKRVSSRDRHAADVTLYGLKRALVEVLAFFPVYRSYVSPGSSSAQDRSQLTTAVERAKLDLVRTTVIAPADGVITNLQLADGEYVAAGQDALTLIDTADVWVNANFRENALENVKAGNPVELVLDTLPGRIYNAKVESIGWGVSQGSIDPETGLPKINEPMGLVRTPQRFVVKIEPNRHDYAPGSVRYGSQANVIVYVSENPVVNAIGRLWMRIVAVLTYVS